MKTIVIEMKTIPSTTIFINGVAMITVYLN